MKRVLILVKYRTQYSISVLFPMWPFSWNRISDVSVVFFEFRYKSIKTLLELTIEDSDVCCPFKSPFTPFNFDVGDEFDSDSLAFPLSSPSLKPFENLSTFLVLSHFPRTFSFVCSDGLYTPHVIARVIKIRRMSAPVSLKRRFKCWQKLVSLTFWRDVNLTHEYSWSIIEYLMKAICDDISITGCNKLKDKDASCGSCPREEQHKDAVHPCQCQLLGCATLALCRKRN